MQNRLMTYDLFKWTDDFLSSLHEIKKKQREMRARSLNMKTRKKIIDQYRNASSRLLFLDYDGTIVPIVKNPTEAVPGNKLLELLQQLSKREGTELVIISGRDRATMDKWFSNIPVNLVAEHGVVIKEKNKKWKLLKPVRKSWKKKINPIMNLYAERLPGAWIEEKEFSIVFHYRSTDPALASTRVKELMDHLMTYTSNLDLQVQSGNQALEVRNAGFDKGLAAVHWISQARKLPRFILSVGDDYTDEDLFRALPEDAFSIKVGFQPSHAQFNLDNPDEVIKLLRELNAVNPDREF